MSLTKQGIPRDNSSDRQTDRQTDRPLISIILPVYNVAPYLPRSVGSLLAQTYPNLEILLVDDGSTDDSLSVARALGRERPNVRVLHQENRGVSAARNAGLDAARGEYVGFVDPDDYVEPDMYAFLYRLMVEADADISVCGWDNEYEDGMRGKSAPCAAVGLRATLRPGEAMVYDLHHGMIITWCKLFRRKSLQHVRYLEGCINGEDRLFSMEAIEHAGRIAYDIQPKYHYCHRPNSAGTKRFTPKDLSLLTVCQRIYEIFCDRIPEHRKSALAQLDNAYLQLIQMMNFQIKDYPPYGEKLLRRVRQHAFSIFTNPEHHPRRKLLYLFLMISPRLCRCMLNYHLNRQLQS